MEQKPIYEIKGAGIGGWAHNGVQIWPNAVVIKQRTRGGDQVIPFSAITEVGTGRSFNDMPLLHATLRIRTTGHTYVVRKLSKAEAEEAKRQITAKLLGA